MGTINVEEDHYEDQADQADVNVERDFSEQEEGESSDRPFSARPDKVWADTEESAELPVDVYQDEYNIVIRTFTPGLKPDEINVAINSEMVTIEGTRDFPRDAQDEDYFIEELYWGKFERTVTLPQEVDVEEAKAEEKHGLLTITLPKIDKNKKTQLNITSAS